MIRGKSVLAVITARGGSKGIPGKNLRVVAGKPLIAWTIEEARKSRLIDRLVLSSDDAEIIRVAKDRGCDAPFVRPGEYAEDETPGVEPVLHALSLLPFHDYVVLLQPTSPLRTAGDIDGCIEACAQGDADSCVSVTEAEESPYWMFLLDADRKLCPLLPSDRRAARRQDLPAVYVLNGAVYVARSGWLRDQRSFLAGKPLAYRMPRERSADIDTERDLRLCEEILSGNASGGEEV
jgi:N-acylneuraminate cytidylyltransferase